MPVVLRTSEEVSDSGKSLELSHDREKFQNLYEVYHKSRRGRCDGCRYIPFYDKMWPGYKSVFDAGAANCGVLRAMSAKGKHVAGIEFSEWVVDHFCSDFRDRGTVQVGPLHEASARPGAFDLVLCTDVLEHVPLANVDASVRKLADLASPGGHLFLIIASDPSKHENHPERSSSFAVTQGEYKVHETVKPRRWWLAKLAEHGLNEDTKALRVMLQTNMDSVKDPRFGYISDKGKKYPPNDRHLARVYALMKL